MCVCLNGHVTHETEQHRPPPPHTHIHTYIHTNTHIHKHQREIAINSRIVCNNHSLKEPICLLCSQLKIPHISRQIFSIRLFIILQCDIFPIKTTMKRPKGGALEGLSCTAQITLNDCTLTVNWVAESRTVYDNYPAIRTNGAHRYPEVDWVTCVFGICLRWSCSDSDNLSRITPYWSIALLIANNLFGHSRYKPERCWMANMCKGSSRKCQSDSRWHSEGISRSKSNTERKTDARVCHHLGWNRTIHNIT